MMIRFDPFAVAPPAEPWVYEIDDDPPRYAPPGSGRLLVLGHTSIRLAPNTEYRTWRNEYVLLTEGSDEPPTLHITASLYLGPRGNGGAIFDFWATVANPLDAPDFAVRVPAEDYEAARRKVEKVLAWYRAARHRNVEGLAPPLTAYERSAGHREAGAS